MKRGRTVAACAIVLVVGCSGVAAAVPSPPRVVLDAGHGGADPGAVNCDFSYAGEPCLYESEVNLRIVRRTSRFLAHTGLNVDLTRTGDTRANEPFESIKTWNATANGYEFFDDGKLDSKDDLQARVNIANCARPKRSCRPGNAKRADAFVSVHGNSCADCGAKGSSTYYHSDDSRRLARLVKREVIARTGQVDRGVIEAAFYVVRWTRMPATLLEAGFISHRREAKRLMRASFQRKIARGVGVALLEFVCSDLGTRGADVLVGTDGRDVLCGLGGDDELRGLGAGDVLLGGDGEDTLTGGPGHDYILGGRGTDYCAQSTGGGVMAECESP